MRNNGIICLEATNILKLKAIKITPEGSLVIIGGENGAGKSSVLDLIMIAFSGDRSLPKEVIRKGADKGTVTAKIDGYTITKTITKKKAYLKVTTDDGATIASAQTFLSGLFGRVSFDPLAFTRMSASEQGAVLRDLVGIDTTGLDSNRAIAFSERTIANREMKQAKAFLETSPSHSGIGTVEESASDLIQRISTSQNITQNQTRLSREIESNRSSITTTQERICRLQEDIEGFNAEIKGCEQESAQIKQAENVDMLKQELEQIEDTNQKIRENQRHADIAGTCTARELKAEKLTDDIELIDAQKAELLRSAKYPIDGLSFGEDGTVIYNDVPFAQASSAEQIRISVAIGLSMNPKLPVMRIYDGSLLDSKSLAMINEMAEAAGAQLWIERVGEGDEVSVVIEDGMVKESETAQSEGIEK